MQKQKLSETDKQKYWDLFVSRSDVYSTQLKTGSYSKVDNNLTKEILFSDSTIGIYQIDKENELKWAVIDIDIKNSFAKKDPNFNINIWQPKLKDQIKHIKNILGKKDIPHYVEFSGMRGYHVWVFFKEPVSAESAYRWIGLLSKTLTAKEHINLEYFPKQSFVPKGHYGNLVKLPLQIHQVSGNEAYFVDDNFNKMSGLPDIKYYALDEKAVKSMAGSVKNAPATLLRQICVCHNSLNMAIIANKCIKIGGLDFSLHNMYVCAVK